MLIIYIFAPFTDSPFQPTLQTNKEPASIFESLGFISQSHREKNDDTGSWDELGTEEQDKHGSKW